MYKTIGLALFLAACSPVAMPANDAGNMDASQVDSANPGDMAHAACVPDTRPVPDGGFQCLNPGGACQLDADCCPAGDVAGLGDDAKGVQVACVSGQCVATWTSCSPQGCSPGEIKDCKFNELGIMCGQCH